MKVRFGVDAETSTRDACAPQNRHASLIRGVAEE